VPQALVEGTGLRADEWMKAAVEPYGGRGGGKPNAAQGQAPDPSKLEEALRAADAFARSRAA
jgi:alanyl-tRNA synthetase